MKQNKKNTSKKIPKNVTGSMPYFLINNMGQIQEFGFGGTLPEEETVSGLSTDSNSGLLAGQLAQTAGSMASDAIGGDTHISQDRGASKEKAVTGGVLKGAGTGAAMGASVGSIIPGIGTAIGGAVGAVAGGVIGGVTSANKKDKEIGAFKTEMERRAETMVSPTTTYYGAYGGELPDMYGFGGDLPGMNGLGDPPKGTTLDEVSASPTPNPFYNEQLNIYKQSLNNKPDANLTATMDEAMLSKWEAYRDKNTPSMAGMAANKVVYDPNSVDANTGLPTQFLDYYNKPSAFASTPSTGVTETKANAMGTRNYLHPQTGEVLDPEVYGTFYGTQNKQLGQTLDMTAAKMGQQNAATDAQRNTNLELIKTMTPEQLAAAKQQGVSPSRYLASLNQKADGGLIGDELAMGGTPTEFNGNTHDEGGIKIGNAEVEDGEIRVGDYIFSDRLTGEDGKTFASAAKKITKKFEEYENDGPSMRTQNKMLEELSFQNDQARLLKKKEDAEMKMAMQEDFAAYGGMIKKDDKGKYVVDKNNRMALMDGAKGRKMSYHKYVDSLYLYGGGIDPNDKYGQDPMANPAPGPSQYNFPGLDMSTPNSPQDLNLMDFGYGPEITGVNSPTTDVMSSYMDKNTPTLSNPNGTPMLPNFEVAPDKKNNFGNEERALLASQLPNAANLFASMTGGNTNFERVNLDEVSLSNERRSVKEAIDRARNIQRENVRGTATSSGDALAALSAGNAGLTKAEMNAQAEINQRENNANIQTKNQERMTNVGISNQETIARQQDQAMRDSVRGLALSGMAENYQGYSKDKALSAENEASNKRLLSLLETGEYEIVEDGKGGYKVGYKNPDKAKTTDKNSKD